jgi:hypothetical protein
MVKGLPPEVRTRVINQLVEAIGEVEAIAKRSSKRAKPGSGGVPPKFRWYQLLANLAGVLDGVLKNVNMDDVREKMDKLELEIGELQRTTPQASG